MHTEWVKANLKEAIEELQSILNAPEEEMQTPSVALAHAYYHINAAYWGAFYNGDPYKALEESEDFPFRYFPTELPEIYGKWIRAEPL